MTQQSHEPITGFRKISGSSNRKFGLTIGAILIFLSVLPMIVHRQPVRLWLLVPGVAALVLGLAAPAALGPINRLWFQFGLLLGRITNPIVMGVLFFCVIVPMGWFLRLRGHDLLRLSHDDAAESYWIHRDPQSAPSGLTKQF